MSQAQALVKAQPQQGLITAFTRDQVDLIKRTVAKGATDDELQLFLYQAQKRGLDPLARQIYFQKRRNNKSGEDTVTFLTGIDGFRAIAVRTGEYAGNDDPVFDDEDSPRKATVTVYRVVKSLRCAFSAAARWDQYYPGEVQGFMWRKMPHLMLGKCAEALALRKAFPDDLSGLYVPEEMEQAGPTIQVEVEQQQPKPAALPRGKTPEPELYDDANPDHVRSLEERLEELQVEKEVWTRVAEKMHGKPKTAHYLNEAIAAARIPF